MSAVKVKDLRHTVAGILFRNHDGVVQFGTHIPRKAYQKKHDTVQRCTVQGGIKPLESAEQAMRRELSEEYGAHFASQCDVQKIDTEPKIGVSSDGTVKVYYWFLIWSTGQAEPQPNRKEVHRFFWDNENKLNLLLQLMTKQKADMIGELRDSIIPVE